MKRYDLIDTLRGLAVISMIGFHACFIISYFGLGIPSDALFGPGFMIWERSICFSFITIAGYSFSFGRHHLKSGLMLFGIGLVITAVTCLAVPDIRIIFGVLTFLGTATLIMIPLDRIVKKRYKETQKGPTGAGIVLLAASLVLFVFTYNINKGFLGIRQIYPIRLPQELYRGYISTFFGFMDPGFYSSDYFSLIPWFFLYLSGYFLHGIVAGSRFEAGFMTKGIPGIKAIGRHALPVYIIHPIVLFIIVWIWAFLRSK